MGFGKFIKKATKPITKPIKKVINNLEKHGNISASTGSNGTNIGYQTK